MRRPAPARDFKWRRRAGVFTCLIMASVFGWWLRDTSRARPPAAYAWIKEAGEETETYFSRRWRRVNAEATVKVEAGQYLYWFTPNSAEVVVGPDQRRAPPIDEEPEALLWATRKQLRGLQLPEVAPNETIRVRSPVGVTRYRNPVIDWEAEPETAYDVAVVDAEDELAPPRRLRSVRPPLRLLALETSEPRPLIPGRQYHVFVRKAGQEQTVGAALVLVAEDAQLESAAAAPGLAIFEAAEAMRSRPYRTGDAWARLAELPQAWQATELARRLRLVVALELGVGPDAARARAELLK